MDYSRLENLDDELKSVIALLPYAEHDPGKMSAIIERVVSGKMSLFAIYPGLGDKPTPEMKLIGSIPDGALYYTRKGGDTIKGNAVCCECMWFDDINISCVAYPLGIPMKYTHDGAKHDKPDKDQIVDAVFTPKELIC